MDKNERRLFEHSLEIDAPKAAVWAAISDPAELARWFPSDASVEPRVGGKVVWSWSGLHDWPQTIEAWEEEARLKTRYDSPVKDESGRPIPLFMEFTLEGTGGRTTLRLVHSGFGPEADFDQEYDGISRGWPVELEGLRVYLENHRGADRAWIRSTFPIDLPLDDAWQVLTGPEGLACGADVDSLEAGTPFEFDRAVKGGMRGVTLCCQPREFTGIAKSHGDAFARLSVENCGGTHMVWLSMNTYGRDAAEVDAIQQEWDRLLGRLFAAHKIEAPVSAGS